MFVRTYCNDVDPHHKMFANLAGLYTQILNVAWLFPTNALTLTINPAPWPWGPLLSWPTYKLTSCAVLTYRHVTFYVSSCMYILLQPYTFLLGRCATLCVTVLAKGLHSGWWCSEGCFHCAHLRVPKAVNLPVSCILY